MQAAKRVAVYLTIFKTCFSLCSCFYPWSGPHSSSPLVFVRFGLVGCVIVIESVSVWVDELSVLQLPASFLSSLLSRSSLSNCWPSRVSCLFMVGSGTCVGPFLSPGSSPTLLCPPLLAQVPGFGVSPSPVFLCCTSSPAWFLSFPPDHRV